MSVCDILIPTFDNPQYLYPCVQSIIQHTSPADLFHIYIVNNGIPELMAPFKEAPDVTVLQQEKNVGWETGLKAGLAESKAPYVLFMNDDTYIPSHQRLWLTTLLNDMAHDQCAATGPSSNVVMGKQNIFVPLFNNSCKVKFLIGFCMLIRREDLDRAGGVDDSLPGGDDLDLSIRLRALGKYLLCNRDVFVYHHGFKTGERVEGNSHVAGGWNSIQKIEQTHFALIQKHGLRAFIDLWKEEESPQGITPLWGDPEAEIVKRFIQGEKVAELGCGHKKTVPHALGIDAIPNGTQIPGLRRGVFSMADATANVEHDLPIQGYDTIIARHILEHMVDAVGAVTAWKKSLRQGGRLIVAVPDHSVRNTIPMNWEHRHAWTPESLKRFMEALGFKTVDLLDAKNQVSFVGVFESDEL